MVYCKMWGEMKKELLSKKKVEHKDLENSSLSMLQKLKLVLEKNSKDVVEWVFDKEIPVYEL